MNVRKLRNTVFQNGYGFLETKTALKQTKFVHYVFSCVHRTVPMQIVFG